MRSFAAAAAVGLLSIACSHQGQPSVHGGNLVEVGGIPGAVTLVAEGHLQSVASQPSFTLAAPSFAWNGKVVAAVPVLPVGANESWSLTYNPDGAPPRKVTLVANPVKGVAGAAAIAYLDSLATIDASLTAPPATDAEKLASFKAAVADLKSVAGYAKLAMQQAQKGATPVGSFRGVTVSLDASGLALLDSAVTAAQEPVVALQGGSYSVQEQGLSLGAGQASALALVAGFAVALAMPEVAVFAAGYAAVTALGAYYVGDVFAQQTVAVLSASDPSFDPTVKAITDALDEGQFRVQALVAADVVQTNASGNISFAAKLAGRDLFPAKCDPAKCANCLNCNVVWSGCFPAGDTCCGAGFWSIACHAGMTCTACNSGWACVPPGGSCPSNGGTGTIGGIGFSDAGTGAIGGGTGGTPIIPWDGGIPDGGNPVGGPGQCGVVQVAGGDAPDQRNIEMGKSSGTFQFDYDTFTIPDEIQVFYNGALLFDTGCVGAAQTKILTYGSKTGPTQITVAVSPDCQPGTSGTGWQYTVGCPQ